MCTSGITSPPLDVGWAHLHTQHCHACSQATAAAPPLGPRRARKLRRRRRNHANWGLGSTRVRTEERCHGRFAAAAAAASSGKLHPLLTLPLNPEAWLLCRLSPHRGSFLPSSFSGKLLVLHSAPMRDAMGNIFFGTWHLAVTMCARGTTSEEEPFRPSKPHPEPLSPRAHMCHFEPI